MIPNGKSDQYASPSSTISVETIGLTKRFGSFTALDNVSIRIKPGSLHALLGENGAGKSTLVKCLMGFYNATSGQIVIDGREREIADPRAAHVFGLGMVYQHFTLVPSLTGAENLVINRPDCPAIIHWKQEATALQRFMETMPFQIPMDIPVSRLAAGQKQKLEIVKQLYLGNQFLVLDEPTSVLTPNEADEVLSLVKALCEQKRLTVLMITHKFREVSAFADSVSVLRHGRYTGGGEVCDLTHQDLAELMMGSEHSQFARTNNDREMRKTASGDTSLVLSLANVQAHDQSGTHAINIEKLTVSSGEIVGIAGISGNGQTELMQLLTGQRSLVSGSFHVNGKPFKPTRASTREAKVRYIPEEPLQNACAGRMTVADNIALRTFDTNQNEQPAFWLNRKRTTTMAAYLVKAFNVKTSSLAAPMESLSGGNVQRAVLARELSGDVRLLIVANPCFGLDFSAVRDIRKRILAARDSGAAVLLMSEDLDEILELADTVMVMSEGSINYQCPVHEADIAVIGHYMAGQTTTPETETQPTHHTR